MRSRRLMVVLFVAGVALALGLVAVAWALGPSSSQAQGGTMHNCPQPGKWAISVWGGADGTDAGQALATCGAGAVAVAYSIDPQTQAWPGWFAGRPEITKLNAFSNMWGVMAHGALGGPTPTPTPAPTPY